MSVLEEIVAHKRMEIERLNLAGQVKELESRVDEMTSARGFKQALQSPGLSVIAEIKRKSPSKGWLNKDLDPARFSRGLHRRWGSVDQRADRQRVFRRN